MTSLSHPFSLRCGKGKATEKGENNSILPETSLHMLPYYKEKEFMTQKWIQFPFTFTIPAGCVTTV